MARYAATKKNLEAFADGYFRDYPKALTSIRDGKIIIDKVGTERDIEENFKRLSDEWKKKGWKIDFKVSDHRKAAEEQFEQEKKDGYYKNKDIQFVDQFKGALEYNPNAGRYIAEAKERKNGGKQKYSSFNTASVGLSVS